MYFSTHHILTRFTIPAICLFVSILLRAVAVNFDRALVMFDHAVRVACAVLVTILVTAPVTAAIPIRVRDTGSDGSRMFPAANAALM